MTPNRHQYQDSYQFHKRGSQSETAAGHFSEVRELGRCVKRCQAPFANLVASGDKQASGPGLGSANHLMATTRTCGPRWPVSWPQVTQTRSEVGQQGEKMASAVRPLTRTLLLATLT